MGPVPSEQAIDRCRELIETERGRHSAAEGFVAVPLALLLAGRRPHRASVCVLATGWGLLDQVPSVARTEISQFAGMIHLMGGDQARAEVELRSALTTAEPFSDHINHV